MMGDLLSFVPNAAADSKHTYVNWLGIVYGLDSKTGKLLWRTDKPSDISGNVQQFIQFMPNPKRYTVTAAGDKVLVERIPPKRMNYQEPYRLQALDAATGKQVWSSESGALSNDDFSCMPIVVGDTVYATGANRGGTEMQLIAITLSTGKLQWFIPLGQAAAGNNWRGEAELPVSNLFPSGSNIFVVTNNGALLCVNIPDRRLAWSFATGEVTDVATNTWWNGNAPERIKTPAAIFERSNVIYFKERDADTMFAINLAGPSLKWKRPVASSETIAGIDGSRIYTVGSDIGGIDESSHALSWSTHLPVTNGNFQPLMSGNSIFMFIGRGIYQLNSDDGDIQRILRGYDRDSGGGRIFQTAAGLITVSDQAVTAYPASTAVQQ
jgi:outer membrane protein assembly factor BamB